MLAMTSKLTKYVRVWAGNLVCRFRKACVIGGRATRIRSVGLTFFLCLWNLWKSAMLSSCFGLV